MTINRTMRIFFSPDGDGGGDSNPEIVTPVDSSSDFDPEKAAADAVAANTPSDSKIEWDKVVPSEMKDKPWMQDILKAEDPTSRFFKDFEGLQTKLGQRGEGVPKEDSPKEEWDKFYNGMGRPETADKYELPESKWEEADKEIGEFVQSARGNEAFITDIKTMFHEEGLTAKQAANLVNKYDQLYVKHNREFFQEAVTAQKEFQTKYVDTFKQAFGDKAEKIQEESGKFIRENLSEKLRPVFNTFTPDQLAALAEYNHNAYGKHFKEDAGISKDAISTSGMGEKERRAEGMKLMADPAYEDFTHPNHNAIRAKVDALYGRKPKT